MDTFKVKNNLETERGEGKNSYRAGVGGRN